MDGKHIETKPLSSDINTLPASTDPETLKLQQMELNHLIITSKLRNQLKKRKMQLIHL